MTNKALNPLLLAGVFVILTVLYYLEIIFIDKPTKYGFVYGLARAMLIGGGFCYFWMLMRKVSLLNNLKNKINSYPSSRNRGGVALVMTLGMMHLVIVFFGTRAFNQYLLRTSGMLTNAVIKDCRQNSRGEHCLYEYMVNNKLYQVQLTNLNQKYKEQDTIAVLYYPKFPAISKLVD
jgi:hypothetical protein